MVFLLNSVLVTTHNNTCITTTLYYANYTKGNSPTLKIAFRDEVM